MTGDMKSKPLACPVGVRRSEVPVGHGASGVVAFTQHPEVAPPRGPVFAFKFVLRRVREGEPFPQTYPESNRLNIRLARP